MIKLTEKQTTAYEHWIDKETNEIIFGGGVGGGKSYFGCFCILEQCLKFPGTHWLIGRSELANLKRTTLRSFFEVIADQNIPSQAYTYNDNKATITFFNGSVVFLMDLFQKPSDLQFKDLGSLQLTGAFVDECDQITNRAWDILKSRIRYKLKQYGLKAKILGTCNPSKDWVYEQFYNPWRNNTLPKRKQFIQSLLSDNPYFDDEYRENLMTMDQESIERLLHGNWDYDSDPRTLCSQSAIMDCFDSTHLEKDYSKKRISADIAMGGRDRFIVCVWFGDVVEIAVNQKTSTAPEIEKAIRDLSVQHQISHSDIIADSDGLGAFLAGYLKNIRTFHAQTSAKNAEYNNIKSQCAFKLAEKINKGRLKIICTPEERQIITRELGALKQRSIDDDEKRKAIISKPDMKKMIQHSPDFLDSLIMGCYFDLVKAWDFAFTAF